MNESSDVSPLSIAQWLSTIAHELRAPLATIKGAATTVIEYPQLSRERVVGFLESIDAEADRLTDMLDFLIDLSRFQLGALKVRYSFNALLEVVEDALSEVKLRYGDRLVTVEGPDIRLLFDPRHIRQVVTCLVNNALARSAADAVVHVSISSDARRAVVAVHDTGAPTTLDRPTFEQLLDQVTRLNEPGLRSLALPVLRLAVSQAFVELNGGQLWFEREGSGNTVCFSLPMTNTVSLEE